MCGTRCSTRRAMCSIAAFLQLAACKSERSVLQTKPAIAFQRGYSCAWRAGAGRCGGQLLFICEMEGMIQGFVVAIWTASLVTIGRKHRLWHNLERVAHGLLYGCHRNLRVSELLIALRTS